MLDATWELVPRPRSRSSPSSRSLKRARLEDDQQNRFAGSRLPSQLVDQDAFFPLGTPSSADFAPLSSRRAGRVAPPRIRPPPSSSQPNLPVPLDPLGLGLNFSTRQVGSFSQPPFQQRSTSMVAPRISARRVGVGAGAGAGGGRASFEGMQEGYRTWVGDAAGRREFEQGVFRDAGFETRSSSLSSSSSWGTPQSSDSVHPLLVPPYIEGTQQDYKFPNPYVWSAPPVPTQQSHPRHQCTPNLPPDPLPAPLHQLHSRPTNLPPRRTLGTSSVGRPDSLSPPNIPLPSRRSVSAEVTRLPPCEEDEGEDPFATKETLLEVVSPPPTFSNSTTIRFVLRFASSLLS